MWQVGVGARAEAAMAAAVAAAVAAAGAPLAGADRLGAAAPGGCSRCSLQPSLQARPSWQQVACAEFLSPGRLQTVKQAHRTRGICCRIAPAQLLLLWLASHMLKRELGVQHRGLTPEPSE